MTAGVLEQWLSGGVLGQKCDSSRTSTEPSTSWTLIRVEKDMDGLCDAGYVRKFRFQFRFWFFVAGLVAAAFATAFAAAFAAAFDAA